MALQIYNTLLRAKEAFAPLQPGHVKVYVCGPTVYDLAHIGHARAYINFDVVVRYLRRNFSVTYVRNYTDVDDKIIKRANERQEPAAALAARYITEFEADMGALCCEPPSVSPKVTDNLDAIVEFIAALVEQGNAYVAAGDVLYAVDSFSDYGRLGRRTREDMEAGARVEISTHKKNPLDFVLWKSAKPGEPFWESPWGRGRPGWHIECSAMAKRYLGDTFDIHGGGRDLMFPHHENEIAQSVAANAVPFARVWMHNGLVNVHNEKMSKSLGNFFTVRDVLEKFDPHTVRFYMLSTHYRSPINFSDMALQEAEARMRYLYDTLDRLHHALTPGSPEGPHRHDGVAGIMGRFEAAMDDDFNTPLAIGELSDMFKLVNDILDNPRIADVDGRTLRAIAQSFGHIGKILGLFGDDARSVLSRIEKRRQHQQGIDPAVIEELLQQREAARVVKNFRRADAIRGQLKDMGIAIKDTASGTSWEVI